MWRRLVVTITAGCASPPAPVVPAAPVGRTASAESYTPPPVAALPASHVECHAFTPEPEPPPGMRKRIYDFAAMPLAPARVGPRTASRPRVGLGRTNRDLRAVFARNHEEIESCWKYQSSRGASDTSLSVGMTIEPLGSMRDLTVQAPRPEDQPLAACVASVLASVSFEQTTSRPIRLTAPLVFTHARQPAWTTAWPALVLRPDRDLRTGTVCTHVLDDAPIAPVELTKPLEVTDWDTSRQPPNSVPQVRLGCGQSFLDVDKRAVRTAVKSNYGALQSCYADAVTRDPGLAGDAQFRISFDRAGAVTAAQTTSGVGDPIFQACMIAALKELWVSPRSREATMLEVNLVFALAPLPSPPPAADDPAALLAAGDAEGSLAAWTAKLRTPVSPEVACRGRAGVLLAIAELAPWLDDPRFHAAIADLAPAAAALAPSRAHACIEPVAAIIGAFTGARGQPVRDSLTHVSLERYAAALPLAPYLDDGPSLQWHYAAALLSTSRKAEAMPMLGKLAWDPKIGPAVTKDLEALRRATTEPIADSCGD